MTKFAILCAGILLCGTLLTGCGSQQTSSVKQEEPLIYEAESSVPPAVRERPHLSSTLEDDWIS